MAMTFEQLQAALAITDGIVTAGADRITTQNFADFLRLYYAGNPIVITNAAPGPGSGQNDTVVVDGLSSYLNANNVAVRAWFTLAGGGERVVVSVRYTLRGASPSINDWTPTVSFPTMPEAYNVTIRQDLPQQPALSTFTLFNTCFYVNTDTGTAPDSGVPLVPGVNFVSDVSATGSLAIIATLFTGVTSITLYGPVVLANPASVQPPLTPGQYPWTLPAPPPGMTLQASLGSGITIGTAMTFTQPAFRLYTPTDSTWLANNPTYLPVMAYTGVLSIPSAGVTVNLLSEFVLGFPKIILTGAISGATLGNLGKLLDLGGTNQLEQLLPADIQKQLGNIQLEDVTVCFAPSPAGYAVRYTYFTVGIPNVNWKVIPDYVEVTGIAARFLVYSPFDSSTRNISVSLIGDLTLVGAELEVVTDFPGFLVSAELKAPVAIPLSTFMARYFPSIPAPTDLTINQLYVQAQPGTSYTVSAVMAQQPAWVIPVGAHNLTISNVSLSFTATTGLPGSGSFGGFIAFDEFLVISARYDLPGDFFVRGDFAQVTLTQLLAKLVNQPVELPGGFDITFVASSVVIQKSGSDYLFLFGTQVQNLGSFAFQVQNVGGQWGFAAGLDFQAGKLSEISGLESLGPLEANFRLNKLLLVVSSFTNPAFQFPDMSVFQNPNIVTKKITLPPQSGGLVAGINAFAEMQIGGSPQQNLVAKFLGLQSATLGAALQIGPNPSQNARISVSISATFSGGTLTAQFGAALPFQLFLIGTYRTTIQGQAVQFDVAMVFVANGAFLSGTMKGGPITFGPLQLANLALEVGVDFEGIPSVGVAATLVLPGVEGALAVFFDSTDPSKSMIAGAVSDITLKTIADAIAGGSVPSELDAVLATIGVEGVGSFNLPLGTATALDNLDVAAVSAAFRTAGVTIPANSAQVLLIRDQVGNAWYLTDLTTMIYYELKAGASAIVASKEAQLYFAPQATAIGTITFPQGFRISGKIDFVGLTAFVDVEISTNTGIAADAGLDPIVIYNENFFRLTGAGQQGGPLLSLATFTQPAKPPEFRPPHFFLSSEVRLLGVVGTSVYINISTAGAAFTLSGELVPGTSYALTGTFTSLSSFGVGGTASVGVNTTIDLGDLGKIPIDVEVSASISAAYQSGTATASASGSFEFQGQKWSIVSFQLSVTGQDLANLPGLMENAIENLFADFLKSAENWLTWVGSNVITGIEGGAEEIGRILARVFGVPADQIAKMVEQYLQYGIDQIVAALRGAGQTAQEIGQILENLGKWTIQQITDAIGAIFGGHADVNLHIDNVVQQHLDQRGTQHQDIPGKHQDQADHTDRAIGSHIDRTIPGVTHQDQPPPHTDTVNSHIDNTSAHIDNSGSPHIDNPTQHQDNPAHGDNGKS